MGFITSRIQHTASFLPHTAMPKPTAEKIGGEYGDVRAVIDVEKLNVYLKVHVPEVSTPVTVKQFKVRVEQSPHSRLLIHGFIGSSLDRYAMPIRSLAGS